jgi:S-methylmethionine-dependent homocysteine/selenocysteine methylase
MMSRFRHRLPQLDADTFLTDGGIETTLIFDDGLDLPDFAAFPLLETASGRDALIRYFEPYAAVARRDRIGIVLETPTWRANPDWADRLGYGTEALAELNRQAVSLTASLRRYETPTTPVVVSGCLGPRGDGYQPGQTDSVDEARAYHAAQVRTFAEADADMVTAITMTHEEEAIGIALAARDADMPVALSFTVETDGTLPTGQPLRQAIEAVDAATDAYPAYYMINCAHPTHFAHILEAGAPWTGRIRGLRANASMLSHAELDEAEELDTGDPIALAQLYCDLRRTHGHLTVLGGCCGTSHRHIDAISTACAGSPLQPV